MVGRPTFLSSPAGEAARFIGRHFCVSLGDTGGFVRVVGCALFWRLAHRAGGCHQAREGNTDRSTHWHCIVPVLLSIPLPGNKSYCPTTIILDGPGNAD